MFVVMVDVRVSAVFITTAGCGSQPLILTYICSYGHCVCLSHSNDIVCFLTPDISSGSIVRALFTYTFIYYLHVTIIF